VISGLAKENMTNTSFYKNVLYAAAFFTGCCFVCGCENDEGVIKSWGEKVVMKEEAIGVESLLSQDGQLKAKLTAPLMVRVFGDTTYAEFPKSLHCDFYNANTQIESWLDSRYGKYFESLNKVYLRDSVVVITSKGDTLKSQDLWWDQNRKMFYTDKYATYHAPGKQIYGTVGLEATQDLSSIIFKYPIGTIDQPRDGFPQ
jgi:LPS export ABC transporter protein LptC